MPTSTEMTTAVEITNAIQDKVLDNICVVQQAVVDCVRNWAETVEMTFSKLPELAFVGAPLRSSHALESAFGFTERMMANQREFAAQVFEAALPATRAAQTANAKAANAQAANAQAANAQTANAQTARAASAKA